jgi:uncharacterized membrane protein
MTTSGEPTESGSPGPSRDDKVAWGIASDEERRWPASLAVLVVIGLQVALPNDLVRGLGPKWLVPAIEGLLVLAMTIASPLRVIESAVMRRVSISLIALITAANVVSLLELVHALLYGSKTTGRPLVYASVPIWITNVIAFGLWYWELDRGGPARRLHTEHRRPDFMFPQQTLPGAAPGWSPGFLDYLYTSFTNATAFSPTDTMPLTPTAKLLMMVQSTASLLIVALVVSRAVNIL